MPLQVKTVAIRFSNSSWWRGGRGLFSHFTEIAKETLAQWNSDNVPRLGAALAFYTILSLAPLLLIIVTIGSVAFGREAARGELAWQIQDLVGTDRALAIQVLMQNAYKPSTGVIAAVLGVITLMLGASSVVIELQDALNTIWRVPQQSHNTGFGALLGMLKQRFYALGLIMATGSFLICSLVLNTWIAAFDRLFGRVLHESEFSLQTWAFLGSFVVIALIFAVIYKTLPKVPLRWGDVAVGATVTALLFTIGKQLIGFYLARTSFSSMYGAAGSFVVLLIWVYYSAQLFFLGAEFTKVHARTRRRRTEPQEQRM